MVSGTAVPMPLTRNAVMFSRCHVSRSSRSSTAIFVSKRTGAVSGCMRFTVRRGKARVLYDFDVPAPEIRAWRPGLDGVVEVLHAHFTDHAYPMHAHDS